MDLNIVLPIAVFLTSLLSGIFGMAGGLILMAIYTSLLPIEIAMILHGYTQLFSNGFRSYLHKESIQWHVLPLYLLGSVCITGILLMTHYKPSKQMVLILLGIFPFTFLLKGLSNQMDITKRFRPFLSGAFVGAAQLLAGASGSILDIFFINSKLSKFEIMGTKAMTQTIGHVFKILFYALLIKKVDLTTGSLTMTSIILIVPLVFLGGSLGKSILHKFSEQKFRSFSKGIIMILGVYLFFQGVHAFTILN